MSSPQELQKQLDLQSGTKRVLINGTTYSINLLPALPAYLLGMEIIETFFPAIGSAADNGINFKDLFPEDRSPFTQIAIYLVKGIKEVDKSKVIYTLLEGATANNQLLDIDTGMRGKVSDVAALIEFALKENFTDFFTVYIKERVSGILPMVQGLLPAGLMSKESQD